MFIAPSIGDSEKLSDVPRSLWLPPETRASLCIPENALESAPIELVPSEDFDPHVKPFLRYKAAAEIILQSYAPNPEVVEAITNRSIFVLVGPTASGRDTIVAKLEQQYPERYVKLPSRTTRFKRRNKGVWETEGKPYFYHSEERVIRDLAEGKFFEAMVIHGQQISGIHGEDVMALPANKVAINDVQPDGAEKLSLYKKDTPFAFFVMPESPEKWEHMLNRNVLSREESICRLKSARDEFVEALTKPYYLYLINTWAESDDEWTLKSKKIDERIRAAELGYETYLATYSDEHNQGRQLCETFIEYVERRLLDLEA